MPSQYDLHTHSTASDGTLDPAELVRRAAAAGVRCLALTDHDTLDGLATAAATAQQVGIDWVSGVEISVTWNGQTVHLVGLNVDVECAALRQGLAGLRTFRAWRAEEMGRRLAQHGIAGAFEGARQLSNGQLVSRTHFARFLVQRGLANDERQVFKHFLVHGRPGYVPGQWAALVDAVGWIRQAGGQAVIAHPARYKLTRSKLLHLIGEFRENGGCALEVVSGSHSHEDCMVMARHAADFNLFSSAGSDFHDPKHPWVELGRLAELPVGCVPIWRDWAARGHNECPRGLSVAA
jgi:3',5'-nucleoside bisphosphate phosphatase